MWDVEDKSDYTDLKILMGKYSSPLFLFVYGFIHNKEVAEEIVSETFVRYWTGMDRIFHIKNVQAWLYVIARNLSVSYLRESGKVKMQSIDDVPDILIKASYSDGEQEETDAAGESLREAISSLPPKCRMAFLLAKVNGLKHKEVARIMNISELTVKNHISYAIRKLSEKLKDTD